MSHIPSQPFDGAISQFFATDAPATIRQAIEQADKGDIANPSYPYSKVMKRKKYQSTMDLSLIHI